MRRALFLDRDGTLIVDEHYLNDPAKVRYYPHVFETLRRAEDLGYLIIVITNQSGLARGLVTLAQMDAIHKKMSEDAFREGVHIRKFYYSPFLDGHGRSERKPGGTLLQIAARDFDIDLTRSIMVGDKWSDVEAGKAAGCHSVFLALEGQTVATPDSSVVVARSWTDISSVL